MPEVYVIIIPIFGLVSNILTGICHKELFGREGMIYCIGAIGIVGFFVWAFSLMGLLLREMWVINSCYMLERLYTVIYHNQKVIMLW